MGPDTTALTAPPGDQLRQAIRGQPKYLEELFRQYGENGCGRVRKYLHDEEEAAAAPYGQPPGTFTPWEELAADTDLLYYEGLHGAVATGKVDVAQHVDLLIGIVPVINLEWIQKLHRDKSTRGYSTEAVTETILGRMPDYVNYICLQFSPTHVNFQRVPIVDTSNPFVARTVPTAGFSLRLIILAYPCSDPRRDELIAEPDAVPRIQRPPWVAKQLEVSLFCSVRHTAHGFSLWFRVAGSPRLRGWVSW